MMNKIEQQALDSLIQRIPLDMVQFHPSTNSVRISDVHITALSISKIADMEQLYPEIYQFPELEALYLNLNGLKTIPDVSRFPKLRVLSLGGNYITHISHLEGHPTLEKISLGRNSLQSILGIAHIPHLLELNLSGNQLSSFPIPIGIESLQILDLSQNYFEAIPDDLKSLPRLSELSLVANKSISKIEGLERCQALTILDLTDNHIQTIEGLEGLKNLHDLLLANNPLSEKFVEYDQFDAQYWVNHCRLSKNGSLLTAFPMFSFIGYSQSGKTASIESLIIHLASQDVPVTVLKHIHKKGFSIDTPGKNTWKFSQAGAKAVVSQSDDESAVMFNWRVDPLLLIRTILQVAQEEGEITNETPPVIILEGFRQIGSKKVLCVKAYDDIASQMDPSVIAVSGVIANEKLYPKMARRIRAEFNLPLLNIKDNPESILKLP
jgi:molybdopterin-guanine dinucleotide biosynthesis protein MobB